MGKELKETVPYEELRRKLTESALNLLRYLNLRHQEEDITRYVISEEKTKSSLADYLGERLFPLKGKSVLDVGCGNGGVVVSCALRGAKGVGLDVDRERVETARLRSDCCGANNVLICTADAENMPFQDDSFDLVIALSLLEHVEHPERAVKEIARVTKREGFCYISSPNPCFPREAHYRILWIPYLPKKIAKIYLRLRGFNPDFFVNHVWYVPSSKITKTLEQSNLKVFNATEESTMMKLRDPAQINAQPWKALVKAFKLMGLSTGVAKLATSLRLSPSNTIVGEKL